jgi:exopolyphosphatase / guanosine-5'-triphosphate,3'-diphosphate pyrophosphatase
VAGAGKDGAVRVAAIDCGTNSVRLLVADLPTGAGPLRDLIRRTRIVRLGEGVDRTGRLSPAAIGRTRDALADYAAEIRRFDARRVRMVATSASRDATNADDFIGMVVATLGVVPEVVSGDEEARLSFTGAVRDVPAGAPPPYLVVDIGGGSTEFGAGTGSPRATLSVDIGCVRMTERHLHSDPPSPGEITAAGRDIAAAVDRALAVVGRDAETMIGLAGTVTTVAGMALGLARYDRSRIHHARIAYPEVVKVTDDLLAMSRAQRLAVGVMDPGRVDVIGAGALVLRIAMERIGAGSVIASEHDILDGVAWSLG